MSFPARYTSVCDECGKRVVPGDQVRYIPSSGWPVHDVCPDPEPALEVGVGEVSCPVCWLVHPEVECDR